MTDLAPDEPLSEQAAVARISELIRPPAATPPKGADGKFQSQRPPAQEPPQDAPEELSETDEAPAATGDEDALGEDDIEIDASDEAEPTQAPSLDMPASWGKTAVELWQTLSPDHQQFLLQHEAKRTSGLSRQANELRAEQERVKAEAQRLEQERLQLAQSAQRFQSDKLREFQKKFGDVQDISELARTNPAKFVEYQAAALEVQQANYEAAQWANAIEQQRIAQIQEFRQAENAKLAERFGIDSEQKAAAFQERVTSFTKSLGIEPQRLAQYTAEEIAMVEDARKWRAAMAKRKQVERTAAPPPRVIKPGAPTTGLNSREQEQAQLRQKLKKTGDPKAAVALIKAGLTARR